VTTTEQIKQLREQTGAGVLEAKRVLDENKGDLEKALNVLKARGLAKADKKADRVALEGWSSATSMPEARSASWSK